MGHAHHTLFRRGAQREFPINFQITNGDSSTLSEGVRIKIEIKVKKKNVNEERNDFSNDFVLLARNK